MWALRGEEKFSWGQRKGGAVSGIQDTIRGQKQGPRVRRKRLGLAREKTKPTDREQAGMGTGDDREHLALGERRVAAQDRSSSLYRLLWRRWWFLLDSMNKGQGDYPAEI